jgi:hypothetical protein
MTFHIDHNVAPNVSKPQKQRLHQHTGPSRRHLRRKLAALQRKLAKAAAKAACACETQTT